MIGLELDVTYRPLAWLNITHVSTFSRNRIREWRQFYDVLDDAGTPVDRVSRVYRRVPPYLSPALIVHQAIELGPATLSLQRLLRTGRPRLRVQVTNLLDNRRVLASGYDALYVMRDATGAESAFYYPLATRGVLAMLDFGQ